MKHAHDVLNLALPRWARPDSDIRADELPDGHASIESTKRQKGQLSSWTRIDDPEVPDREGMCALVRGSTQGSCRS